MSNLNNEDLLKEAYRNHQAGNLEIAARYYQKLLKVNPRHADVLFLVGTLNLQQGKFDLATKFLEKAISIKPDHVAAYNNLGTVLKEQGRFNEAIDTYRKVLTLKPDHAMAYNNLAVVLHKTGRLDEAVVNYRRAIELKSDYFEAYYNIGNVLKEQNILKEAENNYRRAIELKPDYAEAHNNLGITLKEQRMLNEAIVSYNRAIELKPDYAEAHNNLGNALQEQGDLDKAKVSYDKAIELKHDYAEAYNNLGITLKEQGKLDEALKNYRYAVNLKPDYVKAYNNLGTVLKELGKIDEAIVNYDKAVELNPDFAVVRFNRSLAFLLAERFEDGWPEYEWRLRTPYHSLRTFKQPKWDGSPLNGKSILVQSEQGFGDTIQFVRYLPLVQKQGGRVIFECQRELLSFLKCCSGIDEIIVRESDNKQITQFDEHIYLLSLPGIFNTTLDSIPSNVPYIKVDFDLVKKWGMRLGHCSNFKIGIVWAGNPLYKNNRSRSCSLSDFALLADIPGLAFYSLQKEYASTGVLKPPEEMNIINLEKELNDFTDTAAAIANLDLVISVDTVVAHLAGAIGKPVWTLLTSSPDWRWLLDREDSLWYPNMRLFRQTKPDDWDDVFKRVRKALLDRT